MLMKLENPDGPKLHEASPSRILVRVGIAVVVVAAFLTTASVITPSASRASDEEGALTEEQIEQMLAEADPVGTEAPDDLPSLGMMEGRERNIYISASPEGPRYTITDSLGNILGENLTASEVEEQFPDLGLENMVSGVGLMADVPLD